MSSRPPITCHVLDTSVGRPAAGVPCSLFRIITSTTAAVEITSAAKLGTAITNADGRVAAWDYTSKAEEFGGTTLERGTYKVRFELEQYYRQEGRTEFFYPLAEIVFRVEHPEEHYHVPLLLNPYGYSTYRGS